MQLAQERRSTGFIEQQADRDTPAWVIDVAACAVIEATNAGWELLGLEAGTAPVALDGAMPALQRLRQLAADASAGTWRNQRLTFWTAAGTCRDLLCSISRSSETDAFCLAIAERMQAKREEPALPKAAMQPVPATSDTALRAKLAHEIRTPLGAVMAYAELLKDQHFGPLGSDRYVGYARDIYDSARHALGVVDGMLADGAKASGVPQLVFADVDPASIVENCVSVALPLAEQAGVTLAAEVPGSLPRVVADAVSMRQMLLNLLVNAIKFARHGDRVQVAVACDGDGPLRISVVDTGPGMDAAQCTGKAPVRRVASRPDNAGLGLGLPLTRRLAEANGAVLAIESALGLGTCATLCFGKDRLVPV